MTKTTELQVLECKDCKFKTKNIHYLSRHTKLMHGPNADVSNVITCTSCEFETKKSQSLKHHINAQHLNQKRFSCPSCDFKSYYSEHVKAHIRSKHKESNPDKMTKIDCSDCILNISHSTCLQPKRRWLKRSYTFSVKNEK